MVAEVCLCTDEPGSWMPRVEDRNQAVYITCKSRHYGLQTRRKSIILLPSLEHVQRIPSYASLLYLQCTSNGAFPVVMRAISACFFDLFFSAIIFMAAQVSDQAIMSQRG
jgi:hypothetical protein